ncbi:MAG TPA: response regulator, partial [Puia sp.]|nr:response regulator [Puia sp.]
SFSPDLILLDMLLSDADGVAICRELKSNQQTTGIPVVMVSAYPAAVEIAKAAGAEFFVPKPFAISDLLHTIANAITKFDRDVEK